MISAVILVFSVHQKAILSQHVITLLCVSIQRHCIQLRNNIIQAFQISVIGLLTYGLGIRIVISTGKRRSLSQGILHSNLAVPDITVPILLIQGIFIDIELERASVLIIVPDFVNLLRPL